MFNPKQWLGSLINSPPVDPNSIEILFEKLKSGHIDTRKAITEIEGYSSNSQCIQAIGKKTPLLLKVLGDQKQDEEIASNVLQIFSQLMTDSTQEAICAENCLHFLNDANAIPLLLAILDLHVVGVKYQSAKLLTRCMQLKPVETCAALIQHPHSLGTFVDGTTATPYLRNELLLLLKGVTEKNQEIQKIVAFADAFPKLLAVIDSEGRSNGGIIVQDCLHIINNLLRGNSILVNLFRDASLIPRLLPLIELENDSDIWVLNEDKIENMVTALDTVSLCVTTLNPLDSAKSQNIVQECGILDAVCILALGGVHSPAIRSKYLWTLSDIIRGNLENCAKFRDSTKHQSFQQTKNPQHSVMRLVTIIFESKAYKERRAGLQCVTNYLFNNPDAQIALASSFIPPPVTLSPAPKTNAAEGIR